jgi:hypothetical protein
MTEACQLYTDNVLVMAEPVSRLYTPLSLLFTVRW